MDIGPHPHVGLQTVTWLLEGEALHRDSVGSEQLIRPGQLNLMTSGAGIAHSEETPARHSSALHGLQLWVALPDAHRHVAPGFEHHAELPVVALGAGRATVLLGALHGVRSPARAYSPIVGADVTASRDGRMDLALDPGFEHAVVPVAGRMALGGQRLEPATLYYLGAGRDRVSLAVEAGARAALLGGSPFGERILMWWNFVARTPEEIAEAREDWEDGRRFGAVHGAGAARIAAPPLVRIARPQ